MGWAFETWKMGEGLHQKDMFFKKWRYFSPGFSPASLGVFQGFLKTSVDGPG